VSEFIFYFGASLLLREGVMWAQLAQSTDQDRDPLSVLIQS